MKRYLFLCALGLTLFASSAWGVPYLKALLFERVPWSEVPSCTLQSCRVEGLFWRPLLQRYQYARLEVGCLRCPQSGLALRRFPLRPNGQPTAIIFRREKIEEVPDGCVGLNCEGNEDDGGTPVTAPFLLQCGCRASSPCIVQQADGGWIAAPQGETLGPGNRYETFNGAGCQRKPCTEVAGVSSWPQECPP